MKKTEKSACGTSFHDSTVYTTPNSLINAFGTPQFFENLGTDKVNMDFTLETKNGDVITIYDWKEYAPLHMEKFYTFHIGGKSKQITDEAVKEILNKIK